jgi:hypothetical protein
MCLSSTQKDRRSQVRASPCITWNQAQLNDKRGGLYGWGLDLWNIVRVRPGTCYSTPPRTLGVRFLPCVSFSNETGSGIWLEMEITKSAVSRRWIFVDMDF